jgi:hypothetical protein
MVARQSGTVIGAHPVLGQIFAHFDPSARFSTPSLAASKLGALLAPFPNRDGAIAALEAAGAELQQ